MKAAWLVMLLSSEKVTDLEMCGMLISTGMQVHSLSIHTDGRIRELGHCSCRSLPSIRATCQINIGTE
jgi:hypothetical protein